MFGSKIAWANRREGDRVGVGPVTEQVVKGIDPHGGRGRVCERDMARVRVGHCHISLTYLPTASMRVITLHYLLCNWTHPYLVTLHPGYFWAKPFPIWIPQQFSNLVILYLPAYEDGTDRVLRNVGIHRGITQKKTYNIQNMAKVWNQEHLTMFYTQFWLAWIGLLLNLPEWKYCLSQVLSVIKTLK
jgi:hypothetical protein